MLSLIVLFFAWNIYSQTPQPAPWATIGTYDPATIVVRKYGQSDSSCTGTELEEKVYTANVCGSGRNSSATTWQDFFKVDCANSQGSPKPIATYVNCWWVSSTMWPIGTWGSCPSSCEPGLPHSGPGNWEADCYGGRGGPTWPDVGACTRYVTQTCGPEPPACTPRSWCNWNYLMGDLEPPYGVGTPLDNYFTITCAKDETPLLCLTPCGMGETCSLDKGGLLTYCQSDPTPDETKAEGDTTVDPADTTTEPADTTTEGETEVGGEGIRHLFGSMLLLLLLLFCSV